MKITKVDFEKFVKAFKFWAAKFGLNEYKIIFYHEPIENNYAQIRINEKGKLAEVRLTTEINEGAIPGWRGPEIHAKHEAIHLLTNKLKDMNYRRFISEDEIEQEWEALVRKLEKLL